jgi:hypothetical protein
MADQPVLINGRAFDFSQIIFIVLGVAVPSVSKINYSEDEDTKMNYGTGQRPISYGRGKIEAKGSIEISMNDSEAIRDVAPNGSFLNIPLFDILVVFGNPQKPERHVIKNVKFTDDGVDTSLGDTDSKKSFTFIASNIKYR